MVKSTPPAANELEGAKPPSAIAVLEPIAKDGYKLSGQKKSASKWLGASYALIALAAFVAVDVAARVFWHPDKYDSANRSWAYWAVKDFRQQNTAPDIVIFGSSLMLAVLNDGDSTYLNQPFDAVSHHRSFHLESLFASRQQAKVRTGSLAIGGQMASDVYSLSTTLLKDAYKPKLIIWGIAPRDLLDASFGDPRNSETVRFMNKLSANHNVLGLKKPFWSQVEDSLGDSIYVFGKRQDVLAKEIRAQRRALEQTTGMRDLDTVHTPMPVLKYAMANLPEDNGVRQWMVSPYSVQSNKFSDNTEEYKRRYNPFTPSIFQTQASYLEKTLAFCREQHIAVVLVNMPLTAHNLSLLPDGAYQRYLTTVSDLAQKYGAQWQDFNKQGLFKPGEFADYVHLNGLGAMKFFDMLCDRVAVPGTR
jgi:hypothetical protein